MSWQLRHIGWWPPLLGTGIRVTRMDKDLRAIDVEMPLRRWNRNYMGVQFGGSLFALTDPFYMVMLATNLNSAGGSEFVVWDKAASIKYKKPGLGRVRAEFRLSEERLAEIRRVLEVEGRTDARFVVEVKDDEGGVVAEVERVVYCATKTAHEERKKCGVVAGEVLPIAGVFAGGFGKTRVSAWCFGGEFVVNCVVERGVSRRVFER